MESSAIEVEVDIDPLLSTVDSEYSVINSNETITYTIEYTITQDDIDAGDFLSNTAKVEAVLTSPGGLKVDLSDEIDTPIVTNLRRTSAVEVTKTDNHIDVNNDGLVNEGDIIDFEISIENQGTMSLIGLQLDDVLKTIDESETLEEITPSFTSARNYAYYGTALYDNHYRSYGYSGNFTTNYDIPSNIDVFVHPSTNTSYYDPNKGYGFVNTGDLTTLNEFTGRSINQSYFHGNRLYNNSNDYDHIYWNDSYNSSHNNGGNRLEPNTTYTLSVYAKNIFSSNEDVTFNLFAYDGVASTTIPTQKE